MNVVEIEKIEQALTRLHAEMDAPECHGIITGLLLARGQTSESEILAAIAPGRDPGDVLGREAAAELLSLLQVTIEELGDSNCDFNPLLLDESDSLEARLHALSDWIQGFLMGLAHGGVEDYDKLPDEAAEFVEDLVEMARATGYELEEDDEENEASYMELVEYLRTGILLMNELMHPTLAPPITDKPTLH
jgi:uncharacterized protein YgfB (UPF0149 family)